MEQTVIVNIAEMLHLLNLTLLIQVVNHWAKMLLNTTDFFSVVSVVH